MNPAAFLPWIEGFQAVPGDALAQGCSWVWSGVATQTVRVARGSS